MNTAKSRPTVRGISRTISWIRWSPRIASIVDIERRKSICYIGFHDLETAERFYSHVTKKRPDWRWKSTPKKDGDKFHDGRGLCKPRKSERLTDYPAECKWHYPDTEFIRGLILLDTGDDIEGIQVIESAYRNR
ncbi:hypothetical protein LQF76_11015 [Gloeomargaritales cyanobacterium VI4D9]|nr:hypothetical protein LQF76_11015 [Gloeomargaritales cyanobacterium VI4D9]